ncbi:MAG TPA: hypothetical protein VM364_16765 [Vicinamibacterales bacterium]|nr:hypothetical protein [Vicinamibacterales bacterium]
MLLVSLAACARARPALPAGAGTPFPGYEAAYEEAVRDCRGARTVLAELGLSGRAGGTRLRGRISAGLAAPAQVRLEGIAFGRPVFLLVARDEVATLLLPRDDRVVRDAAPQEIIEALAGVAVAPPELRAAIAGCGLGVAAPSNGRTFGSDWAAVDTDGTTTYLRRIQGRWRVAAAVRQGLTLHYADLAAGPPATILLRAQRAAAGAPAETVADITLRVSQLEINTPIDPRAFELDVPASADPLSLEELRRAGPLGERGR